MRVKTEKTIGAIKKRWRLILHLHSDSNRQTVCPNAALATSQPLFISPPHRNEPTPFALTLTSQPPYFIFWELIEDNPCVCVCNDDFPEKNSRPELNRARGQAVLITVVGLKRAVLGNKRSI